MRRLSAIVIAFILIFSLTSCGNDTEKKDIPSAEISDFKPGSEESTDYPAKDEESMDIIRLFIGDEELSVKWEDNESVTALKKLIKEKPLKIQMSMYGGFEQVGSLGTNLPRNDVQITANAGDIVLYSGNQIVIFYGQNSWSYTKLGKITDVSAEKMTELLGNGDVTVTLSD